MKKKILIIGASGGIGRVVASFFLDLGYEVIGTNYKEDFPETLLKNPKFTSENLDVKSKENIIELATKVSDLEGIVNCSGVVEFEAYNEPEQNLNIWNNTMDVNLKGSYLIFEFMKKSIQENGSYIMISSTDANYGGKVNTAYAASKAGINSLTKSLALMYPDSKIRVNAIAPGWVETAMMLASGNALVDYARDINPLSRNGKPSDVAELVNFLVSNKSSYINGQIITLDGGYTLQDPTLVFEEQQLKLKS